jgi:hypothetical protein
VQWWPPPPRPGAAKILRYPNTGKLRYGHPQGSFRLLSGLLPIFGLGFKMFFGKQSGFFDKLFVYRGKWTGAKGNGHGISLMFFKA